MNDRLFDFAADAAVGADRIALAALGAQQPRFLADETRPFDAREGMHLHVFIQIDRPIFRVDHDHRMNLDAARDVNILR